jgi:hypothetical protein
VQAPPEQTSRLAGQASGADQPRHPDDRRTQRSVAWGSVATHIWCPSVQSSTHGASPPIDASMPVAGERPEQAPSQATIESAHVSRAVLRFVIKERAYYPRTSRARVRSNVCQLVIPFTITSSRRIPVHVILE